MGKVEAGDIQAGMDKLAEDLNGAAGGAEGSDDLCAAGAQYFNRRGEVRHCIWRGLHEVAVPGSFFPSRRTDGMTSEFCFRGNSTRVGDYLGGVAAE
jgi:hypothetical protein